MGSWAGVKRSWRKKDFSKRIGTGGGNSLKGFLGGVPKWGPSENG